MKRYFRENGPYHKRSDADPRIIQFASILNSHTPEGRMGAGLLRFKYAQLIGVPPEHLGAAYHANADKVLARGGPLDTHDGHVTNTEHNTLFNDIRARYRAILSGPTEVVPRPAKTNQKAEKTVTLLVKEAVGAGKQVAGVSEGKKTVVNAALTSPNPKKPARMLPGQVNSAITEGRATRRLLMNQISRLRGGGNHREANKIAMRVGILDATLDTVIRDNAIVRFEKGDGRMLAQIWSRDLPGHYELVKRSDGKWDIRIDGKTTHEGVTTGSIASAQLSDLSTQYHKAVKQAQTASNAEINMAILKAQLDITLQQWKDYGEEKRAYLKDVFKLTDSKIEGQFFQQLPGGQVQLVTLGQENSLDGEGRSIPKVIVGPPTGKKVPGPGGLYTTIGSGQESLFSRFLGGQ
jgi:hypothetical protein|tara:strand:+ start:294 stop:1514 length:1221 start_codon:yes stop_codon:yes gene_type:complete